jgi:hypothetical protein
MVETLFLLGNILPRNEANLEEIDIKRAVQKAIPDDGSQILGLSFIKV